jgi:hypothetical protein
MGYFHPEGVPLFAPFSSIKFSSSDSSDKHSISNDTPIDSKSATKKTGSEGGKHRSIPVRPQQGRHNKKDKNEPFFKPVNKSSKSAAYSMFICGRNEILPQFRVRKARVEDTDDLVPMLRKQHVSVFPF